MDIPEVTATGESDLPKMTPVNDVEQLTLVGSHERLIYMTYKNFAIMSSPSVVIAFHQIKSRSGD